MRLEATEALKSTELLLPRLFTPAEVDELNMERPPKDQLELMPSGLLRHHCCFETCPQYMCNMATTRDKQLGTRNGIYRHFKCFFCPDRQYYNGVHNIACTLFRRYRYNRTEFVQACVQHIEGSSGNGEICRHRDFLYPQVVEGIFDQLTGRSAN